MDGFAAFGADSLRSCAGQSWGLYAGWRLAKKGRAQPPKGPPGASEGRTHPPAGAAIPMRNTDACAGLGASPTDVGRSVGFSKMVWVGVIRCAAAWPGRGALAVQPAG
jgi:hypothetical protein